MNCNKKLYLKESILTNKKRSNTEITKSNSSFKTNNFKVSRITAKLYEKESGKIVKKDKIISTYERSSVKNQEHKICNITNNERILASSNTNSYKNMISQDFMFLISYKRSFIRRDDLSFLTFFLIPFHKVLQ